jgi:hypothetical protein
MEPPPSLSEEYNNWLNVQKVIRLAKSMTPTNSKNVYELTNILERWLLTLANAGIRSGADKKMIEELQEKALMNALDAKTFTTKAKELMQQPNPNNSNAGVVKIIDEGTRQTTIKYKTYSRTISRYRANLLLSMGSRNQLATMLMRYSAIISGSQHWSIPGKIYKYIIGKYETADRTFIEGFTSPVNSQIIRLNNNKRKYKFCSLFPDTDEVYGSLGSFFDYNFSDVNVIVNPPFIEPLMNMLAKKINAILLKNSNVRWFIIVPSWRDAEYHLAFVNSKFKVFQKDLKKDKHSYINTSRNGEKEDNDGLKIIARFNSTFFILSNDAKDVDNYKELDTLLDMY